MLHSKLRSITLLLCAVGCAFTLNAQNELPLAMTSFMMAHSGDYVDMEQEVWKPVHAQRVRDGKITAWYLFEIIRSDYNPESANYMTVELYPNWAATEAPYGDIDKYFTEVHGTNGMSDDMSNRTGNARDVVASHLWRMRFLTGTLGEPQAGNYLQIAWFDRHPGGGNLGDMLLKHNGPVNEKRIAMGDITNHQYYTKVGYSEMPGIDAASVVNYTSYEKVGTSGPGDYWSDVHPNMDRSEFTEMRRAAASVVGLTLFKLVDYVTVESLDK